MASREVQEKMARYDEGYDPETHLVMKKRIYLARPYGFSARQKERLLLGNAYVQMPSLMGWLKLSSRVTASKPESL